VFVALACCIAYVTANFSLGKSKIGPKERESKAADDTDDYRAEAYTCDPNSHDRVSINAFQQGDLFTICIELDERAIEDGISLVGVDSFNWHKKKELGNLDYDHNQVAIEDGAAARNGYTLYDCAPGSTLCFFQSMLMADFFWSAGVVAGSGIITVVADSAPDGTRNLEREERILQSAGKANMGVTVNVVPSDDTRPPLRTAGVAGPTRAWTIASAVSSGLVALAWIAFGV
jgi:hypothetical protein